MCDALAIFVLKFGTFNSDMLHKDVANIWKYKKNGTCISTYLVRINDWGGITDSLQNLFMV